MRLEFVVHYYTLGPSVYTTFNCVMSSVVCTNMAAVSFTSAHIVQQLLYNYKVYVDMLFTLNLDCLRKKTHKQRSFQQHQPMVVGSHSSDSQNVYSSYTNM